MGTTTSEGLSIGSPAPTFQGSQGVDGARHDLDEYSDARALVTVFTCNHCPVAVTYEDRLIAIDHDYRPRGVRLVAIHPNDASPYPEDSLEEGKPRATAKSFPFPYRQDEGAATAHDLRTVLDRTLSGERIGFEPTRAMGGASKWKP